MWMQVQMAEQVSARARLSPQERQVFLRVCAAQDEEEIARALGIRVQQVYTVNCRIKAKIRRWVAPNRDAAQAFYECLIEDCLPNTRRHNPATPIFPRTGPHQHEPMRLRASGVVTVDDLLAPLESYW